MADVSRIHESLEAKLDLLPPDMLAGDRDRVRAKMAELQKATDARTARMPKRPRSPSPLPPPVPLDPEEGVRRREEYKREMEALRGVYRTMEPTPTAAADLDRLRLRTDVERSGKSVRDQKRRLTTMEHSRAKEIERLRAGEAEVTEAVGARAAMRPRDLVAEFTRAPWWTSPSPDPSVKTNPIVAQRAADIKKRKRRSNALPTWAKPGATNAQFKRGLAQISSKMKVLSARTALSAYIDNATTDEQGSELYLKMSARDRELETLSHKFDADKDWRQLSALADTGTKRRKRPKTRKPRAKGTSPPPKRKKKSEKATEGRHDEPAEGFDNRFFV